MPYLSICHSGFRNCSNRSTYWNQSSTLGADEYDSPSSSGDAKRLHRSCTCPKPRLARLQRPRSQKPPKTAKMKPRPKKLTSCIFSYNQFKPQIGEVAGIVNRLRARIAGKTISEVKITPNV